MEKSDTSNLAGMAQLDLEGRRSALEVYLKIHGQRRLVEFTAHLIGLGLLATSQPAAEGGHRDVAKVSR